MLRSAVPASAVPETDGGAYRTRTGDNCLEGRCVTVTPMLRIAVPMVHHHQHCLCLPRVPIQKRGLHLSAASRPLAETAGIEPTHTRVKVWCLYRLATSLYRGRHFLLPAGVLICCTYVHPLSKKGIEKNERLGVRLPWWALWDSNPGLSGYEPETLTY